MIIASRKLSYSMRQLHETCLLPNWDVRTSRTCFGALIDQLSSLTLACEAMNMEQVLEQLERNLRITVSGSALKRSAQSLIAAQ